MNLDWVKHGAGVHQLYPAAGDLTDDAGHVLITAYAAKRPDGDWSLLIVNKDPDNSHEIKIDFDANGQASPVRFAGPVKKAVFGAAEYKWHSTGATSHADPDGPPQRTVINWKPGQITALPRASIVVLTGATSSN